MALEIRAPTDDEWPAICHADARAFGHSYSDEEIEQKRALHEMPRFRVVVDDAKFVGIAGSYGLQATVPGGAALSMGGVTWVSIAATHRRQGLMRRLIGQIHDDIEARGEPVASLFASEGGIYENVGYGVSTTVRTIEIDPRSTSIRDQYRQPAGSVRYLEGADVVPFVTKTWDRFRHLRAGEIAGDRDWQQYVVAVRSKPDGDSSPAAYLAHRDGYVVYRTTPHWNDGHPAHRIRIVEFAAVTPQAHVALWQTLLDIDLVGQITSSIMPMDDPLPFLLRNPRALRTTSVNDGVWVNVRDVATAFAARTYRSTDRIVVESDGVRWAIDGGPDGASCRTVRTRPDLTTTHAWFSSLLYGGMSPSTLVAGRRMAARNTDAITRGDQFFCTALAPHCQSMY